MLHVLVADSKIVRVFESEADETVLRELATFHNVDAAAHERDLTADRPGSALNTAAGVHQSYEPKLSAWRHTLQRWIKMLGPQLQALLAAQRSEGVVLVAAPRLLPLLRASLPPKTRALIGAELPRDLAKQPIDVLSKRLQPSLREVRRSNAVQRPHVMRYTRPRSSATAGQG
jgi:protein required for attachment to host cells